MKLIKAGVGGTPSELGMIRFERDVLKGWKRKAGSGSRGICSK